MSKSLLFAALLFSIAPCVGCGDDDPLAPSVERPRPPQQGNGQPDAEIVAVVDQALAAGKVDGIKWGNVNDVVADLKTVYSEQGDRLVWFDGTKPESKLEPALEAIAHAGDYGLDPADYDGALLATQWPAIKSGSSSARDRAAFDKASAALGKAQAELAAAEDEWLRLEELREQVEAR